MGQPLDIALLRTFVAIYETGSVTAAAQRLFVSQPTVSYTLAKLRETLDDPLFVRSGNSMTPTPRARDCFEPFAGALVQIENALAQARRFVPAESTRRFRLAMSDIGELIFLPPIFDRVQACAPRVELEVVQATEDELPGWLASGKVDAAIGNLPSIRGQTHSALLFHEHYVCLLNSRHPRVKRRLSLAAFTSERHVYVASKFSGHRHVEDALRTAGVLRRVALQVPHFTILPQLISSSELLVVMPSRVADLFKSHGSLKSLELPIEVPPIEVRVHWDRRHAGNVAQQWLIGVVREALQAL